MEEDVAEGVGVGVVVGVVVANDSFNGVVTKSSPAITKTTPITTTNHCVRCCEKMKSEDGIPNVGGITTKMTKQKKN